MALHHVGAFTAMVAVVVLLALLALLVALCVVCCLLGALGGVGVLGAVLAAVSVLRGHCGLLRRVVGHFGAFSGKPRLHHALVIGGEGVARLIHTPAVQDRALCCQSLHVPFLLALSPAVSPARFRLRWPQGRQRNPPECCSPCWNSRQWRPRW